MQPGKLYHIYTHANGSENLFRNDENFRYFLKRYEEFIPPVADTLAYCLMPNHLHLLVRIKNEAELKEYFKTKSSDKDLTGFQDLSGLEFERFIILQFSHLFNAYSKAYNKMYQRMGALFVRAFKRKEITDDFYFTQVIHYIHANPIHHGFANSMSDWLWSSYENIVQENSTLVRYAEVIQWFGNKNEFITFHQKSIALKKELEE